MHLVICSDIHDNIWALETALQGMAGADALLFLGDFCAPFTLVQLAEGFAGPIHIVWGNNDGDKWSLTNQAHRFDHVVLHGELAELELAGKRVAMNHYPEIARGLTRAGHYDLVCYGHDHQANHEVLGPTVLFNPGEIMGRLGSSAYAIYDLATGKFDSVDVSR